MSSQRRHAHRLAPRRRRAVALIYVTVAFTMLLGMAVLGVDVGRIHLAKSELQSTADAAARYAVRGMHTSSTPMTTALAHAAAVCAEARVDGAAPTVTAADVVRGNYDAQTRTFTPNSNGTSVSITVHQTFGRTGAPPLMVTALMGNSQKTINATAIAQLTSVSTQINPPASGNLWLAGMPDNTQTQNFRSDNSTVWDNNGTSAAPKQRPLEINLAAMNLHPGDTISLEGITGSATYNGGAAGTTNDADGNTGYLVANGVAPAGSVPMTSSNGLSNTRAPIGAVMAVFMTDDPPNTTSAPTNLDFGTSDARDYSTISPQLKQVFYIGDGKRANGETQSIVVPPNATRMYFGMMDAWQWNDNIGNFEAKFYSTSAVHLTK